MSGDNGYKYRNMSESEFRVDVGLTLKNIKDLLENYGDKLNKVCFKVGEHDKDIAVMKSEYGQLARDMVNARENRKDERKLRLTAAKYRWAFYGSIIAAAVIGTAHVVSAAIK